jgi:hypothetical protein
MSGQSTSSFGLADGERLTTIQKPSRMSRNLLEETAASQPICESGLAMSRRFWEDAPRGAPNKEPWDRRLISLRITSVKDYFVYQRIQRVEELGVCA